jgi:hypothetical protein
LPLRSLLLLLARRTLQGRTMTRKAPSGPKHARCVHHEPYPEAPGGHLCFADDRPDDDAILGRMVWADQLSAIRAARHLAHLARPVGDGISYGRQQGPQMDVRAYHASRSTGLAELVARFNARRATS